MGIVAPITGKLVSAPVGQSSGTSAETYNVVDGADNVVDGADNVVDTF